MPNVAAGLGLLGLGVMVVVAVGTIAYSLFYEQPRSREEDYSYARSNNTWSTSELPTSTRTVRRKKRQGVSSEFSVSDLPCSICKEIIDDDARTKLQCNHCFHYQCICDWFDICAGSVMETGTCPMCREKFSAQDLKRK